jgi:hypothetical protein
MPMLHLGKDTTAMLPLAETTPSIIHRPKTPLSHG